jgi:hypothetical protein
MRFGQVFIEIFHLGTECVYGGRSVIIKDVGGNSVIIKDVGGNPVILAKIGGNPVNCRKFIMGLVKSSCAFTKHSCH